MPKSSKSKPDANAEASAEPKAPAFDPSELDRLAEEFASRVQAARPAAGVEGGKDRPASPQPAGQAPGAPSPSNDPVARSPYGTPLHPDQPHAFGGGFPDQQAHQAPAGASQGLGSLLGGVSAKAALGIALSLLKDRVLHIDQESIDAVREVNPAGADNLQYLLDLINSATNLVP